MGIELTKKELATVAGYSYRRLYDIDMGLTDSEKLFVKGEGGKYDLALFVQRWVKYNQSQSAGHGDKSLDEVKAEHEFVKMKKTQLEVERLEGRLVDVEEIKTLWGNLASRVMNAFLKLPSKIAPRLVMLGSVSAIRDILDGEIRGTLSDIADTPLPQQDMGGEKEEEGEE